MSHSSALLLLGGSGLVGTSLRVLWADQYSLEAPSHAQVDVLDEVSLERCLAGTAATTVVNLVAWADVDGAEPEKDDVGGLVYRLNVDYPRRLAELCARYGRHLIHISTDYVFDGTKSLAPYVEEDPSQAVCWYAETKLRGEHAVRDAGKDVCIARIEMPFTGRQHPKRDLARTIATLLQQGRTFQGVTDQRITPVFLDDVARALSRLVEARYMGVIHIGAADWTTPFDFAYCIAQRLQLPQELIAPETFARFSQTRLAQRPQHSWLDVSHFTDLFGAGVLRPVEDELDQWTRQWQPTNVS